MVRQVYIYFSGDTSTDASGGQARSYGQSTSTKAG